MEIGDQFPQRWYENRGPISTKTVEDLFTSFGVQKREQVKRLNLFFFAHVLCDMSSCFFGHPRFCLRMQPWW